MSTVHHFENVGNVGAIVAPHEASMLLAGLTAEQRQLLVELLALQLSGWDLVLSVPLIIFAPPEPEPASGPARYQALLDAALCELWPADRMATDWPEVPAGWVGLLVGPRFYAVVLAVLADMPQDGSLVFHAAWVRQRWHLAPWVGEHEQGKWGTWAETEGSEPWLPF